MAFDSVKRKARLSFGGRISFSSFHPPRAIEPQGRWQDRAKKIDVILQILSKAVMCRLNMVVRLRHF